ncbi:MAG: 4-hydroxy-tetrahydrodipicolinate reductase [Bacteroidales bacterium]|nr:4-hydroxy-tetrahydrodipicolinate reductase [Bacteroidales bacterium]
MNIAIIGYGRMGHEVESIAMERGHTVNLIIDINNVSDLNRENLGKVDVAIEFSSPSTAFSNVSACLNEGVPVVSGTTGWLNDLEKAKELCLRKGTSFIHSTNFSIGVNILFRLNSELAKLAGKHGEYQVLIEEIHHTRKLDAPSGTAITLANGIVENSDKLIGWVFEKDKKEGYIPVRSVREGNVPGTHIISWESESDIISIRHEAKNRKGFALGAVVAAEFIYNRKGVFTMEDVLGF